jgi:hypothetical protein
VILSREENSYPFPSSLLKCSDHTFAEWKLAHVFYYLKNLCARKGDARFSLSARSLERDYKIQKIKNKAVTISSLRGYLPEEPIEKSMLVFSSEMPEEAEWVLIPDRFMMSPYSWLDRWSRPGFLRPKRVTITGFTRFFVILLSLLQESQWNSEQEISWYLPDLFTCFRLDEHLIKAPEILAKMRKIGALKSYSLQGSSLTLHFNLDEFHLLTRPAESVEIIDSSPYDEGGESLKKHARKLAARLPVETYDPASLSQYFPYSEFLSMITAIGSGNIWPFYQLIEALSDRIKALPLSKNIWELRHSFEWPGSIADHKKLFFLLSFADPLIPWGRGRQVEQVNFLARRTGLDATFHLDTIIAGPLEGKARKEKSLPHSVHAASEIWVFPIFESLRSHRPYRLLFTIYFKKSGGGAVQLCRQVYLDRHRERFLPPLRLTCDGPGQVYCKITCSKAVHHLAMRVWTVVKKSQEQISLK